MKQHEAVIKAMQDSGGFALLGDLYQTVLKIPEVEWKTKTPFASIRRIVQDERFFFKIRPGLWALKSCRDSLPSELTLKKQLPKAKLQENTHTFYQGLLTEIGNLKGFNTAVPNQDRNKFYLGGKLGEIASISEFYKFGYPNMINRARTVDVVWFNSRKMPSFLFEVEHTTPITPSLTKFVELQDYYAFFNIVADIARKREFETKLAMDSFSPIAKRVKFVSYEQVVEWNEGAKKSSLIENQLGIR